MICFDLHDRSIFDRAFSVGLHGGEKMYSIRWRFGYLVEHIGTGVSLHLVWADFDVDTQIMFIRSLM